MIKKNRIFILDFLRGLAVVNMLAYHTIYDLVYIFGHAMPWYTGRPGHIWQQAISWTFILVSGATQHYVSRPWRRTAMVLGGAAAVSVVTFVFMPQERILFGILHFIGTAMLVFALLGKWIKKIPLLPGLLLSGALFILCKSLPTGYLGILDWQLWPLPLFLFKSPALFAFGLPSAGFFSADYFPLIPWIFLYLFGYFAYGMLKPWLNKRYTRIGPVTFIGQHSLFVYLLHQPVIYAVCLWLQYLGLI